MASASASLLNDKWEALSDRFNLLKSIPRDQEQLINAAIAQWQDWYWADGTTWPAADLMEWQDRYVKTARLLDAVAAKTNAVATIQETDSYAKNKRGTKITYLPPLLITARPPQPPVYVPPPPIVYQDKPFIPPPPPPSYKLSLGVDTSGFSNTNFGELQTFSRDPGTVGWDAPTYASVTGNRTGLLALLISVGAAVVGKRQGWL